jgi:hypothetical protein
MTHLEFHPHAFLNENNVVINVAVFDEWAHNHQLLEDIKELNNAYKIICCCQYGLAGIGHTYDEERDALIPPKPYESWILNEETYIWQAPILYPTDGNAYKWNEETISWIEIEEPTE